MHQRSSPRRAAPRRRSGWRFAKSIFECVILRPFSKSVCTPLRPAPASRGAPHVHRWRQRRGDAARSAAERGGGSQRLLSGASFCDPSAWGGCGAAVSVGMARALMSSPPSLCPRHLPWATAPIRSLARKKSTPATGTSRFYPRREFQPILFLARVRRARPSTSPCGPPRCAWRLIGLASVPMWRCTTPRTTTFCLRLAHTLPVSHPAILSSGNLAFC